MDRRAANQLLMQRMREAAPPESIERFQLSAKRFMAGIVPLGHFIREFRRAFGHGDDAVSILRGLHAMLPPSSPAAEQLCAAIEQAELPADEQDTAAESPAAGGQAVVARCIHSPCCLVWLRRDLRLADNPCLLEASKRAGELVIPVYIDDTADSNPWPVGGAQKIWLAESIRCFGRRLAERYGSRLLLRRGDALCELRALLHQTGAVALYFNRRYEPALLTRDATIKRRLMLEQPELSVKDFNGFLLWEPTEVPAPDQPDLRVHSDMTSFSEAWLSLPKPRRPLPPPKALRAPAAASRDVWPESVELRTFGMEPVGKHTYHNFPPLGVVGTQKWGSSPSTAFKEFCEVEEVPGLQIERGLQPDIQDEQLEELFAKATAVHCPGRKLSYMEYKAVVGEPDFTAGFRAFWGEFGEAGAECALAAFLARGMFTYGTKFTRADDLMKPSSHFAPFLATGDLSPNTVYHAIRKHIIELDMRHDSALWRRINRSLRFREWWWYNLYHYPHTPDTNLRPEYDRLAWRHSASDLRAWQRGETGYPLVDAGMRELWVTGYMHHFVRMTVASFLCKDLLLHWRLGQDWFWDTLCDADLAINAAYWQNMGSSGVEQMRWYDPVGTVKYVDPTGHYIRKWCPELARLPDKYLRAPWTAPPDILKKANLVLGPKPSPGGVGAAAAMLHQITTGRASLPAAHSAAARPKSARAAKGTGGGGGGGGAGGWYPETIVEPGAGLRRYRDALFELGETGSAFENFSGIISGVGVEDTSGVEPESTAARSLLSDESTDLRARGRPAQTGGAGGRGEDELGNFGGAGGAAAGGPGAGDSAKLLRSSSERAQVARVRRKAKAREAHLPQHAVLAMMAEKNGEGRGAAGFEARRARHQQATIG